MPLRDLIVAPHLDATAIDGKGVVVVDDRLCIVYGGAEYAAVVRAVEDPSADHLAAIGTEQADRALAELRNEGVLVAATACDPAAAWWARLRTPADRATAALAAGRVSITALGPGDPGPVTAALEQLGVTVATPGDIDVVLAADYLAPELETINATALDTGRPWLLAATETAEIWVGPLFAPDRGPCWECLAHRLRLHRRIDDFLSRSGTADHPVARFRGALPSTVITAAGVLATELAQGLVRPGHLSDRLVTLDTRTWMAGDHHVSRRPQCPACGVADASLDAPALPPALTPAGATPVETTLRSVTPDVTWSRWRHHVSPVSGVVEMLRPVAGVPGWQHVFEGAVAGGMPPIRRGTRALEVPRSAGAHGKGTSAEEARASALCEALERYCGRFGGEEPRRRGSLRSFGDAAIHPNDCMHFSHQQYARREELNRSAESFRNLVPEPFDPDEEMDWSPCWSLSEQRERLLPTAYGYYEAPRRDREFRATSNGCAAGNTIDEAILHGLLELVERDHVAIWWYNRLPAAGIELDSVGSGWLVDVRRRLSAAGSHLWALDLTADLGIPVVAALASSPIEPGAVAVGFGAALDGPSAVVRAVTEVLQGQWAPSTFGERPTADDATWSHLWPDPDRSPTAASDLPHLVSDDLRGNLDACLDRLVRAGIDVLVLDQTRPDVGLPVVRVVAPPLRHFWPRFGPGRLYDVPVGTGRLERPRAEGELVGFAPGP